MFFFQKIQTQYEKRLNYMKIGFTNDEKKQKIFEEKNKKALKLKKKKCYKPKMKGY